MGLKIYERGTGHVLLEIGSDSFAGQDLSGANLKKADLTDCIFRGTTFDNAVLDGAFAAGAVFEEASLQGASLEGARFRMCFFNGVNIANANLTEADFRSTTFRLVDAEKSLLDGADLKYAILNKVDLSDASLRQAYLRETTFSQARFRGADFTNADFGGTTLTRCSMLGECIGLDATNHAVPSYVDMATIERSIAAVSHRFWSGIGLLPREISVLRQLYGEGFLSCFLSHAEADQEFADKLHAWLKDTDVRVYHYKHDLRGGKPWRTQLDAAIAGHEKLVIVCSESSLARPNVIEEIMSAVEHERTEKKPKLFPIRIDDFILSRKCLDMAEAKTRSGEWAENWVKRLLRLHIPDFSKWRNPDTFNEEFLKLLESLRTADPS